MNQDILNHMSKQLYYYQKQNTVGIKIKKNIQLETKFQLRLKKLMMKDFKTIIIISKKSIKMIV